MREVAHASRGACAFLLDVVRHDAVVLVDDVALQAVALAVLDPTRSTNIWPLTCKSKKE